MQRFPPAGAAGLCNPDRLFHYRKVIVVPTKPQNSSWQPSQALSGFSFRKTTAEVVLRDAAHHCGSKTNALVELVQLKSRQRSEDLLVLWYERIDESVGAPHTRASPCEREVWTQCWVHKANNYYHRLKEEEGRKTRNSHEIIFGCTETL